MSIGLHGSFRATASAASTTSPPETGPCLDTYGNIGQGCRRPLLSLVAETAEEPLFHKIPQTGIGGDDQMMWDADSDEIAGILLKVDWQASRTWPGVRRDRSGHSAASE